MDIPQVKAASASATRELQALFEIAPRNRQAAWYNRLIACLPHAIFTGGDPEIILNPAGLTYYNLEIKSPNDQKDSTTTSYIIPELIDTFLINEGVGIAIEARHPKQAVDLSYGDILGFHLYRTFAEPEDHIFKTDKPRAGLIRKGADIIISDVTEQVMPTTSRKLIEGIMQHLGIKDPSMKLVYLPESEQYELVFSLDTHQYSPTKTQGILQQLGWFLPRYYSYLACDLEQVPCWS